MEKPEAEPLAIVARDVWKSYGSLQVLKGLNLEARRGETIVILGRSGVGKSVLLRQILGIEIPDKGYIEVNGQRVSEMNETERLQAAKKMGMLFQGAALFDSLTVGENTAFYLRQHERDLPEKELKERAQEALKMVGLENTENKMPSDLSGGMRKRAALARLIVYRPQIILYDEPTTGLDPVTANQIDELIQRTQAELKATSLVVTHDLRSALEVGDRLAFHHEGKIAKIAPKKEFIESEDPLLEAFFENGILTEKKLRKILGA